MVHVCDTCGKLYTKKRNLKRHVAESHVVVKYWNCSEPGCKSKFVRRSYYVSHLERYHKFSKKDARVTAIKSTQNCPPKDIKDVKRGDTEDVSDDDSVLDLVEEIDNIEDVPLMDTRDFVDLVLGDLDENNNEKRVIYKPETDEISDISDIEIGEDISDAVGDNSASCENVEKKESDNVERCFSESKDKAESEISDYYQSENMDKSESERVESYGIENYESESEMGENDENENVVKSGNDEVGESSEIAGRSSIVVQEDDDTSVANGEEYF